MYGMARNYYNKIADWFVMVAAALVIAALASCFPVRGLLFKKNGTTDEKYDIVLLDGQLNVELDSWSKYSTSWGHYTLSLWAKITGPSAVERSAFDPFEIEVLYDGCKMSRPRFSECYNIDTLSASSLRIAAYFNCEVDLDRIGKNARGEPHDVDLTIAFNEFLRYDGNVVLIDTIHAIVKPD
jgi:hypothetical protein